MIRLSWLSDSNENKILVHNVYQKSKIFKFLLIFGTDIDWYSDLRNRKDFRAPNFKSFAVFKAYAHKKHL